MQQREYENAYVSMKSHNTSQDIGMIMVSYRARVTENAALSGVFEVHPAFALTILHIRLLVLERIALNPALYPNARVQRRHVRMIPPGKERWNWIAKQSDIARQGITATDVEGLLIEANRIIEIIGISEGELETGLRWLPR